MLCLCGVYGMRMLCLCGAYAVAARASLLSPFGFPAGISGPRLYNPEAYYRMGITCGNAVDACG